MMTGCKMQMHMLFSPIFSIKYQISTDTINYISPIFTAVLFQLKHLVRVNRVSCLLIFLRGTYKAEA